MKHPSPHNGGIPRRQFLRAGVGAAGLVLADFGAAPWLDARAEAAGLRVADLPVGSAPAPVPLPHFPSRAHAFVWRNWQLIPVARIAQVLGCRPAEARRLGQAMGLGAPPRITADQQRRSALTVIRRNWHLLPYDQLLELLGWTADQLAFSLREDDFLFVKLGGLKPRCEPVRSRPADEATRAREVEITRTVRQSFPDGPATMPDPLFGFIGRLAAPLAAPPPRPAATALSPRYCYSYFALYGDPLLEQAADPYPDGYLARLAAAGVDGVWLQGVLYKLARFPWDPVLSLHYEERLANLRALVARARRHGIGIYLYLNEPRAMPLAFYTGRPEIKGAVEAGHAALCTSDPTVQTYLRDAVASICRAAPDLAGLFTISGSENLTNCCSHGGVAGCPRCGKRAPAEVIAELNNLLREGIGQTHAGTRLIAWDWGWADAWVEGIISRLQPDISLMSVSEWSLPIRRGGVETAVGEYSISAIGPGPRAQRHWAWARQRGLKTLAKVQAGCTWELSAVPYIPAVENVARHAANLRTAQVDGLMLGWTLGGYPSPNLEVVAELVGAGNGGAGLAPDPDAAMRRVAERRFGGAIAPAVVEAWRAFSAAFREFPFHGGVVYHAPMQFGPSNLLWAAPTGYQATMVGFPYDDLDGWRAVYPAEVFISQFRQVAAGFAAALASLQAAAQARHADMSTSAREALAQELSVAEAATLHFRTTANQAAFVLARRALAAAQSDGERKPLVTALEELVRDELAIAQRMHSLQTRDSRLGFEASNQYYYVPLDLAEKVLNCRYLLAHWLAAAGAGGKQG